MKANWNAECLHCGNGYISVRTHSRYCDVKCRVAAFRERVKLKKLKRRKNGKVVKKNA